jgi:CRISPR-associated protein (TIGR03985 family)
MTSDNTLLPKLASGLFNQVQHLNKNSLTLIFRRVITLEIINQLDNGQGISIKQLMNHLHDNDCRDKSEKCTQSICRLNKTAQELLQEFYELNDHNLFDIINSKFEKELKRSDEKDKEDIDKAEKAIKSTVMKVSRRMFNIDLRYLCFNELLIRKKETNKSEFMYHKKYHSPTNNDTKIQVNNITQGIFLDSSEKHILLELLVDMEAYHPAISRIFNKISPDPFIIKEPRLLFRADNIIPDLASEVLDHIYDKLDDLWGKQLVSYQYKSSSHRAVKNVQVYPVCFLFYKKVSYLYAWGLNPDDVEHWYPYRLDHIDLESWENIEWDSLDADSQLRSKYNSNRLPSSYEVSDELRKAWGHKIHRKPQTLLLRFDPEYYDLYIENTDRGPTAKVLPSKEYYDLYFKDPNRGTTETTLPLGAEEAIKILEKNIDPLNPNPIVAQYVAESIQRVKLHPHHNYFKVEFRSGDNYTKMQLRSWGAKVEVLAPFDLREEIMNEAKGVISNYRCPCLDEVDSDTCKLLWAKITGTALNLEPL